MTHLYSWVTYRRMSRLSLLYSLCSGGLWTRWNCPADICFVIDTQPRGLGRPGGRGRGTYFGTWTGSTCRSRSVPVGSAAREGDTLRHNLTRANQKLQLGCLISYNEQNNTALVRIQRTFFPRLVLVKSQQFQVIDVLLCMN